MQRSVGLRPITLELGSISATIVCDDADLERAAPRCVAAGFRRAGQVCTSLQRLFVQDTVIDRFTPLLTEAAGRMKVGDPHDAATMVGPMISEAEARRAEEWIAEAVAQRRTRRPRRRQERRAVRADDPPRCPTADMKVMCEEVFAPVLSIVPFRTLEEAVDEVNSVPFGLAAGVFTSDINRAMFAARALHVGIVHINEPSSSRVDLDSVRRRQGQRSRPRGPEVRHAGDDRRAAHHLEPGEPSMMTGAMFMAECLRQEGVTKVFGQCGHTNYALIDACHKLGIEYVSFRHEQMAAHAADAYFRVTHKLAVLNVHISPGMTNALTGVVTAAADCTPMVVIAGNTPSYHHAREPHQGIRFHADASQGDIYRPICKRVWRVDDAKLLHDVMPRALNVAQTGRPGAVFLDIPMDVFSAHVEPPVHATTRRRPADGRTGAAPASVTEAAELLAGARSPAIFAGNGAVLSEAAGGAADPGGIARRSGGDDADGEGHHSR